MGEPYAMGCDLTAYLSGPWQKPMKAMKVVKKQPKKAMKVVKKKQKMKAMKAVKRAMKKRVKMTAAAPAPPTPHRIGRRHFTTPTKTPMAATKVVGGFSSPTSAATKPPVFDGFSTRASASDRSDRFAMVLRQREDLYTRGAYSA